MNEIKKLVKTSNRSQSMLVKYGYLMNELKEMMNISKGDMLKDNKFDEALSIGTKTN